MPQIYGITYGEKTEIDKNGVLHHYVFSTNEDTGEIIKHDTLPDLKRRLKSAGIGDFCFVNMDYNGYLRKGEDYKACNIPSALEDEYNKGKYRSIEAKKMLEDILTKKFGYGLMNGKCVEPVEYKRYVTNIAKAKALAEKINNGEEIVIRFTEEIMYSSRTNTYGAPWCTCKEARGVAIEVKFDKSFKFKKYPGYDYYFHVLDDDGNIIKTRNHYCTIQGYVEVDENSTLIDTITRNYGELTIVIEKIRVILLTHL